MLFLMAVLPSFVFLFLVWKLDRIEKEPIGLMIALFVLGALAGPFIAIMEAILSAFNFFTEGSFIYSFIDAFWIVGPCEEIGKFIVLFLMTWWSKHFDHKYDAIVYSAAVTLGFATLENVLYVFDPELGGASTAIMRMVVSVPGHLTFGLFMGLFYGFMRDFANKRKWAPCILFGWLSVFVPITLHGIFDFLLFLNNGFALLIFFVFVVIIDVASFVLLIVSIFTDKQIVYSQKLRESIYIPDDVDFNSQNDSEVVF